MLTGLSKAKTAETVAVKRAEFEEEREPDKGNTSVSISGGTTVTAGSWVHVAVCRSSGVTKMFCNGQQVGSSYTDANNYLCDPGKPYIGTVTWDVSQYGLNGYVEDFRITKSARYTSNFTVPTASFPTK